VKLRPPLIAPFEADAQLAYLEKKGLIDIVITEDSDIIVYGCREVCIIIPCPIPFSSFNIGPFQI
jgi:5'-3' exonuclease